MRLLDWFRGRRSSGKEIAEQRLRLILAHDRANISPGMLEILKDELIKVISRHLDVDPEKVEVKLTQDQHETRLIADIPLRTITRSRGQ